MNAKGLLLAGSLLAGAALVYWWTSSSSKKKRYVEEDAEGDIEADWVTVMPEVDEKNEAPLAPVSPRTVKMVLDDKKEELLNEEQAEEFQLVSPRLEAFLTAEPAKGAPKAKTPVARGPKALSKRPARAAVPKVKLDEEDEESLDPEEVKKILARGKKMNTAEEGAAPFPIVSPRLEKFLESK